MACLYYNSSQQTCLTAAEDGNAFVDVSVQKLKQVIGLTKPMTYLNAAEDGSAFVDVSVGCNNGIVHNFLRDWA